MSPELHIKTHEPKAPAVAMPLGLELLGRASSDVALFVVTAGSRLLPPRRLRRTPLISPPMGARGGWRRAVAFSGLAPELHDFAPYGRSEGGGWRRGVSFSGLAPELYDFAPYGGSEGGGWRRGVSFSGLAPALLH